MTQPSVAIVDYGMGNLFNVQRALERVGVTDSVISNDKDVIRNAQRLVLPGVGAYGDGMKNLDRLGLVTAIQESAASGKPVLGVCLGMQLLMSESEEFGIHQGLGLICGRVRHLEQDAGDPVKIPHIGWESLHAANVSNGSGHQWDDTVLQEVVDGSFMYFVHSFVVQPEDSSVGIGVTRYGGDSFCAAMKKDNVTGVQFHPELSSASGLAIYKNFMETN